MSRPPDLVRSPRYELLDACRGVACLMVVVHHAGFALLPSEGTIDGPLLPLRRALIGTIRHLDLGVPLFFVISGYCIAASVDATRRRGSSSLRFLSRRVWRIYPPYWAALLWFLAVTIGFQRLGLERLLCCHSPYGLELVLPQSLNPSQWFGNVTLTESWRHLVGGGSQSIFTRVAWSLCFEEQFYFLCFAILLIAPGRLYGMLAMATLAIVLFRIAAADVGYLQQHEGTLVDLWHQFAVGLAVYWTLNVPSLAWQRWGIVLGLSAMAVLGFHQHIANTPVTYSTAASAAFGLLLIGLRDLDGPINATVIARVLRIFGRRSYSIYLYHLPVTSVGTFWLYEAGLRRFWTRALVTVPLVASVAVAVSCLAYWLVERHFLNPPVVGRKVDRPDNGPVLTGERPANGAG